GTMRGIDCPFEYLGPIARDQHFGDADLGVGGGRPRRRRELGHVILRAHVGPDHSAPFLDFISLVPDFLGHGAGGGLGHHFDDIAFDVHLPAVVQAAQAAFFVAAIHQRHAPVRTVFVHHADTPVGVAEHHQVFPQYPGLHGIAVVLADLFAQAHRYPVPAHQLPHG